MTALAITAAEEALRDWLLLSSGLAEGSVIFANQAGHQPQGRFVTLRVATLTPATPHSEARYAAHPEPEPGAELLRTASRPAELVAYVQANSPHASGAQGALALAQAVQDGLEQPEVQAALRRGGLSVADPGAPRNVTTLLDTRFQSRFALDVRFNCTQEAAAALTFIGRVSGEGELSGANGALPPIPFDVTFPEDIA